MSLEPILEKVNFKELRAVSRGLNGVIEATIHAKKYVITKNENQKEKIDHYAKIVSTCGGPNERNAIKMLYEFLN